MNVQDVLVKKVRSIGREESLATAARIMWEQDCGALPVVKDGKPIAMITDRDIAMAAMFRGKPLGEIPVSETMSKTISVCRPTATLFEAEAIMRERQVRRLPVVDAAGSLVGIVSLSDILRHLPSPRRGDGRAREEAVRTFAAITRLRKDGAAEPLVVVAQS